MTDKEFKRLKRADLVEIIYQMQQKEERYIAAISQMRAQLESRKIQMENVGSIAEASLVLGNVFASAQEAADLYLEQIRQMHEQAEQELSQARAEAKRILAAAEKKAQQM